MQIVTRFAVDVLPATGPEEPPPVSLSLVGAWVAVPPGHSLRQLRSVDLPIAARVAVGPADIVDDEAAAGGGDRGRVAAMPYVGEVDLVSDLDQGLSISETQSGFVVRGNVSKTE